MEYVVLGPGAVGGVIAARLQLAGHPTTVVARGAHLGAIRSGGLVLDGAEGRRAVPLPAVGTVAEVTWSPDTVVLLCVKGHQTAAALADLAAHAPPAMPIVCAQNGVANEPAVLRRFRHTYGLTVMLPSVHLEPGVVVEKCHPVPGLLDLGCFPSGLDATADQVAADLRSAGFESVPRPDIMAWKHRKLLANAGGDVGSILGRDAAAAALADLVRAEGEAALAAAGIAVVSKADDDVRRGELLQARTDERAAGGNSLRQSLTRGLDSEIDYRAGELVLLGRLHGVATPACDVFCDVVRAMEAGGSAPDAADVLARLRP